MDKVAVDPKLFVTCRLCLEDMGLYQIVPVVQKQIKFCFDIEVAPFDGLPQLICKKCEAVLSTFYKVKNSFLEKQNSLKVKVLLRNEKDASVQETSSQETPLQGSNTISSKSQEEKISQSPGINLKPVKEVENTALSKPQKRKRSYTVSSASNSVNGVDSDDSNSKICKPQKELNNIDSTFLNKHYKKRFVCKFCSSSYSKKLFVLKHSLTCHSKVKKKYPEMFKYFCVVTLNKINDHRNGANTNKIQYSRSKFIQQENDINYYVIYTANNFSNCINSSDSESDNEVYVKRKNRRPLRLLSRSESNETVVIPNKSADNSSSSDFEDEKNKISNSKNCTEACINIDSETSESKSECSNVVSNIINRKQSDDYKVIQNIIEICYNKYTQRVTQNSKKSELKSQLQHKILSIGRKIINKQGLNCTGILRFLEHQNLDISWLPKGSATTYARILTKMKEIQKDNDVDFGWVNEANEMTVESSKLQTTPPPLIPITTTKSSVQQSEDQVCLTTQVGNQAILYTTNSDIEGNSTSKLLNASPVANPKQLPKKITAVDNKANVNVIENVRNENKDDNIYIELDDEIPEDNLCMPVITSTTSLAFKEDNKLDKSALNNSESNISSNNNYKQTSAPRIKVKPVSELMPTNVTHNTQQNIVGNISWHLNENFQNCTNQNVGNVKPYENIDNVYLLNVVNAQTVNIAQPVSMLQMPNTNISPTENAFDDRFKNINDYIILDTVEMPNTKTDSPFIYFKNLLQMHNILLLDSRDEINQHFSCLIKFKVVFKQENVKPVVLCLSLHCLENIFYIDIKDGGRMHIDMVRISANWQWEIIKIYQGDVVKKILLNSQKISAEMHETTKRFLCLLKSINLKKDLS
ncbi:uncharacterized protein LOC131844334 [Achroia grisella]|uniref:uncharacterized protein LOC131844334 n=1 Tax=Achroia grisella TaxID=688607 RepID=UPI0027D32D23|nr:uncharacterized protein LOC131844334 [Achroia grisella]XP_059049176.1 uncharacterized protein LOC131844334 [Achroia grisella]